MPRYVFRIDGSKSSKIKYRYRYLSAKDEEEAESAIRNRFGELAKGNNVVNWDMRVFSLEFRRVAERQWLPGPFNAKINSNQYYPSFNELEDWEDRQILLFPIKKRKFLVRTSGINSSGWKDFLVSEHFRAFSLPEAIDKVEKVYYGINTIDNSVGNSPVYKMASLEVRELGKDKKWITLYDSGIPEVPTASGSPHANRTLREGGDTVITYSFGGLAKWGKRIKKEEECFPCMRRDLWELCSGL